MLDFRKNWTGDKLDMVMEDFHNVKQPEQETVNDGESNDA